MLLGCYLLCKFKCRFFATVTLQVATHMAWLAGLKTWSQTYVECRMSTAECQLHGGDARAQIDSANWAVAAWLGFGIFGGPWVTLTFCQQHFQWFIRDGGRDSDLGKLTLVNVCSPKGWGKNLTNCKSTGYPQEVCEVDLWNFPMWKKITVTFWFDLYKNTQLSGKGGS